MENLESLINLKKLYLSKNKINEIKIFDQLTLLDYIDLESNKFEPYQEEMIIKSNKKYDILKQKLSNDLLWLIKKDKIDFDKIDEHEEWLSKCCEIMKWFCKNKKPDCCLKIIPKLPSDLLNKRYYSEKRTFLTLIASDPIMEPVCLELIKYMSDVGINKIDIYGTTALMAACSGGLKDLCLKLIPRMSTKKLNKIDEDNDSALFLACREKKMEDVVMALLPYMKKRTINNLYVNGKCSFVIACQNQMNNVVELMVDKLYDYVLTKVDSDGNIPLLSACQTKSFLTVEKIIERVDYDSKMINHINNKKETILLWACTFGPQSENICLNIFNKIKYENINQISTNNESALFAACKYNLPNLAYELILKSTNDIVNKISNDGYTCLIYACMNKMYKIAKMLVLKTDPDIICYQNESGMNALLYACENSMLKTVSIILKKISIQNLFDLNHKKAIDLAIKADNSNGFEIANKIIELTQNIVLIECGICYGEKIQDKIIQLNCHHSHVVCFDCYPKLDKCPYCKKNFNSYNYNSDTESDDESYNENYY
jgi:ankyrin repeat protein